ncbi:thiopurine S-methyltransferase [Oceaniovalibus sp. ACAM 378]|uniref:thiopurine S-methyltransferase n=1 Tax=Oceaniovalibus sp. ACAM 378 TaxID=2599923 RepID=UPI0011D76EA6|nr:thiopurine S-methyltransferase [Oceaniovalibus sp. ACAM 378]TYB90462.1 thiopurine S-methyltransferase [Oceaniovalibus sp. ACAM 378]
MESDFWHQRWGSNRIGFHEGQVNALFAAHFGRLHLRAGARLFLPLCGKTRDVGWLRERGFAVAGAELSRRAIGDLFTDLDVTPEITRTETLENWHAPGLDFFVGDIFDLTAQDLGPVDAVYDRAALVALPPTMRDRYAPHLIGLTGGVQQLLITFEYDQTAMDGPPFSIDGPEVRRHYDARFDVVELERCEVKGGLKGIIPAEESAWHLNPR